MLQILFLLAAGFAALIFLLIILTILFGKRVEKKWDLEANFINDKGKEIGEFDIELRRYAEDQGEFNLVVKLDLRHESLRLGRTIEVLLADKLVMQARVEKPGAVHLRNEHLVADIENPGEGDLCKVRCEGHIICQASLRED